MKVNLAFLWRNLIYSISSMGAERTSDPSRKDIPCRRAD